MGETRKRLRRKTAGSPWNYADVLVLTMGSWMPYLCLQDNSIILSRSPSEFTWDSIKRLRFLCKSIHAAWETHFSVKLHIDVEWLNRFQLVLPTESLTFLRSDDANHRILTYLYRRANHANSTSHYAVVAITWKSLLILQQSKNFGMSYRHKRYDWRDYALSHWKCDPRLVVDMRPLVFQDVFHPTGSLLWYQNPGKDFHQYDEVAGTVLPTQINGLSSEEAARVLSNRKRHRLPLS